MAFRPNYRFQRTERDRAKQAKKEEKLKKRQERSTSAPAAEPRAHPDEEVRSDR